MERKVGSEKWTWYVGASWGSTGTVDPLPANSLKNALICGFPLWMMGSEVGVGRTVGLEPRAKGLWVFSSCAVKMFGPATSVNGTDRKRRSWVELTPSMRIRFAQPSFWSGVKMPCSAKMASQRMASRRGPGARGRLGGCLRCRRLGVERRDVEPGREEGEEGGVEQRDERHVQEEARGHVDVAGIEEEELRELWLRVSQKRRGHTR